MNIWNRLLALFAEPTEAANLQTAIASARAGKAETAIHIFDKLILNSRDSQMRANALFNRAVAYADIGDEFQAASDLKRVSEMSDVPDTIRLAATEKMAFIRGHLSRFRGAPSK